MTLLHNIWLRPSSRREATVGATLLHNIRLHFLKRREASMGSTFLGCGRRPGEAGQRLGSKACCRLEPYIQ